MNARFKNIQVVPGYVYINNKNKPAVLTELYILKMTHQTVFTAKYNLKGSILL